MGHESFPELVLPWAIEILHAISHTHTSCVDAFPRRETPARLCRMTLPCPAALFCLVLCTPSSFYQVQRFSDEDGGEHRLSTAVPKLGPGRNLLTIPGIFTTKVEFRPRWDARLLRPKPAPPSLSDEAASLHTTRAEQLKFLHPLSSR